MNKCVIVVCIVLAIISQTACDANQQKEVAINQEVALANEELVSKPHFVAEKSFPDFIYDVGPRFAAIKKEDLDKAKTFNDFIDAEEAERIASYKTMTVTILNGDNMIDIIETSSNETLTPEQLTLLHDAPYSTNLIIKADFMERYPGTDYLGTNYASPYLTIVPEKQATYVDGKEALKEYLKVESEIARKDVDPEKLQAAKLFFTVTKHGTIESVKLDRSSGYPIVDKTMIELITKTQTSWKPAENSKGEKVDQELVVSFGLGGC